MLDRSRIRSRAGAHRRRLVGARLVTSGTVGKSARRSARVGPGAPLDRLGRGRSGGRASGSRAGFRRRGRGRLGRPPGRRGAASALRLRPTLGRPTELVQLVLGPAPAAIAARGVWSYALLAVGDVPVGGGPCLDRRVDRARGLGEVVDPVDLRLQELAGGRGRGARVRCHALAHAPHVTGGSGAPAPGPVGGGDIGDETGRGVGRRPGSLMARAAASASSRRPARDSRPVSRSWCVAAQLDRQRGEPDRQLGRPPAQYGASGLGGAGPVAVRVLRERRAAAGGQHNLALPHGRQTPFPASSSRNRAQRRRTRWTVSSKNRWPCTGGR